MLIDLCKENVEIFVTVLQAVQEGMALFVSDSKEAQLSWMVML